MPKILITGSSGVGKTTVIEELARRSFTAIDADAEPGLSRLEISSSGKPVAWPEGFVNWSYYSWNLQAAVLKKVLSRESTVFLAGINGNQTQYYPLFNKLIVLTISPEEHGRRLYARPQRTAGDDDQNIQERLRKYQILLRRFLDAGAIPIDASGTAAETVDAILRQVGNAA